MDSYKWDFENYCAKKKIKKINKFTCGLIQRAFMNPIRPSSSHSTSSVLVNIHSILEIILMKFTTVMLIKLKNDNC